MPTQTTFDAAAQERLVGRLRRIEGQARGVQKMIEEERDCSAVLDQIASIKAAVNGLSAEAVELYALHCLAHPDQFDSPDDAVRQMVRTMLRAGK